MPTIGRQVDQTREYMSLWQQRRSTVALSWSDVQWRKFDAVCNEELSALLRKNAQVTQEFDETLTNALNLLGSE